MYVQFRKFYEVFGCIDCLGSIGSAPGLTVFVSVSRSHKMQIFRAICLYSFRYMKEVSALLRPGDVLGFTRASCSIFTATLS